MAHVRTLGAKYNRLAPIAPKPHAAWSKIIATGRGLYSLRLSRFAASRLKRIPLPPRQRGLIRIFLGTAHALSKRGQNARMGKGVGSFFTTRRLLNPGFVWVMANGSYSAHLRRLQRYLRARWGGRVRFVQGARWAPHRKRVARSWTKVARDHTPTLVEGYRYRKRERYYSRFRLRLRRRWRRLYRTRRLRILRRLRPWLRISGSRLEGRVRVALLTGYVV